MLTLTRKPEETIVIGDGPNRIEIIVKEIRRNQVRIGILAPDNVRIFRKELVTRDGEAGGNAPVRQKATGNGGLE